VIFVISYCAILEAMFDKSVKEKAKTLRKEGYSYNLIAEKTRVSKSTLYTWLSEIPYKPNQEVLDRIGNARAKSGQVKHRRKLESFKKARQLATDDIGSLSERDIFMLGIGLYIGEGDKNETVGFVNADPSVINLGIKWLRGSCGLETKNLRLAIHIYPDNDEARCVDFWSKSTGIPKSQFGKTQVDRRKGKKYTKTGKLPYGTAHLRVKSCGNKDFGVLLSRRIHAWMDLVTQKRV